MSALSGAAKRVRAVYRDTVYDPVALAQLLALPDMDLLAHALGEIAAAHTEGADEMVLAA